MNMNAETTTVGQLIETLATQFASAELFYGHGTDNPGDEAAALVFHVLQLDHFGDASLYAEVVAPESERQIRKLAAERVQTRRPLAYMLGEAWFAGMPFTVDERVLVPRSPVAELILGDFQPWLAAQNVSRIADIGTGSGCIGIACARQFPDAQVVETDISADALDVARENVARHGLVERVSLVKTDLMDGLEGPFDVIISNPPYVPDAEEGELPAEYGHEPALGLFSGSDGLDSARRILQDAPHLLSEHGILVLEVGAQWLALNDAFPDIPFTWLEFEHGGEGVAVLTARELGVDY